MKKYFLSLLLLFIILRTDASVQDSVYQYNILLTGASFASYQNSWFETGCRKLNAKPINRAVGGEAIANTANRIIDGSLYSPKELDEIDAFVIMQVHNKDVFDPTQLLCRYTDYTTPFDRSNYAAAYDYVIKRYMSDCYELKNNPDSKYYGSKTGKPPVIILCTNWHDARVTYNTSIRKLAEKWGLSLVEFDKNIGFSKNTLHPVTGEQQSLLYAYDSQMIDGVKHGQHPHRGEQEYIQQRMASIFVELMQKILPIK